MEGRKKADKFFDPDSLGGQMIRRRQFMDRMAEETGMKSKKKKTKKNGQDD